MAVCPPGRPFFSKAVPLLLTWMQVWQPLSMVPSSSVHSHQVMYQVECQPGAPVNTLPSAGSRGRISELLPLLINFLSSAAPVWLIRCLSKSWWSPSSSPPSHSSLFPFLASWLTSYVLLKKCKYTLVKSTPRSRRLQSSCHLKGRLLFQPVPFPLWPRVHTGVGWPHFWRQFFIEHTVGCGPALG